MKHGWHFPTVINLSQTYRKIGRTSDAKKLLETASHRFRSEAAPYYLLAEIAEENKHLVEAEGWYRKALRADPLNGFAHLRFARFLQHKGVPKEALKHAERAVQLLPDSALCWRQLGSIHEQAGELDEALIAFQRSLAVQPDSDTRQQLIDLLHKMGEHERAERMQQSLDAYLRHQKQS